MTQIVTKNDVMWPQTTTQNMTCTTQNMNVCDTEHDMMYDTNCDTGYNIMCDTEDDMLHNLLTILGSCDYGDGLFKHSLMIELQVQVNTGQETGL